MFARTLCRLPRRAMQRRAGNFHDDGIVLRFWSPSQAGFSPPSYIDQDPEGGPLERCQTCQYFDRHDQRSADGKLVQSGQCRREAPRLSPVNVKAHMIEGVWPHVRGDDWCGEHRALAKRLDTEFTQLTQLLDDPLIANLTTDTGGAPRYVPLGMPREPGRGSSGN
jgi:hypothetical protein